MSEPDEQPLIDGNGDETFETREAVVELHRAVVAAGWEHEYHPTSPYENLVSLLATVDELGREPHEDTVVAFAFKYICGFGRETTPRVLDAIADDPDVDVFTPEGGVK
jgi:hypothetical protein